MGEAAEAHSTGSVRAEVIKFASPEDEERYRNRARRGRDGEGGRRKAEGEIGRTLPHSLEAEEYLLSCCLLDGASVVARCLEARVGVGSFYDPKHGIIFGAILRLFGRSSPIDVMVLAEELKTSKELDQIGGYAFVSQVSSRIPTTAQASYFIAKVREQALLRDIIRAGTGVVEDCYAFSGGIDEFAGAVSQKIMALTGDRTGLPGVMSHAQLMAADLPEADQLIKGVLHRGRKTLLLAPSKASKTWTTMDISEAIASGTPWMGFETVQARVLHIDLELPDWDLKKRAAKLQELRGLRGDLAVDWWSLDGHQRSIDELLPLIAARAPRGKYGLIALEPAYMILGKRDENDNADITDFMRQLARLAMLTGAAVLCTHHFAKGDASKKEAKDRGSGAGAWMRAPDTAITLTPLNEDQGEDCYVMEFVERSMKRHAPVGVRFDYPVFRLQSGLDLNALREAGRPKESRSEDVAKLLGEEKLTHTEWMRKAQKQGMSESTFKRRKNEALERGEVEQMGAVFFVRKAE